MNVKPETFTQSPTNKSFIFHGRLLENDVIGCFMIFHDLEQPHLIHYSFFLPSFQCCPSCGAPLVLFREKFGELSSGRSPGGTSRSPPSKSPTNTDTGQASLAGLAGGWVCTKCGVHIVPNEKIQVSGLLAHASIAHWRGTQMIPIKWQLWCQLSVWNRSSIYRPSVWKIISSIVGPRFDGLWFTFYRRMFLSLLLFWYLIFIDDWICHIS